MRPIVTDRVAWSVGRSVCHTGEPCKNGLTDRDAVWGEDSDIPKQPCVRWGGVSDLPMGRGDSKGNGKGSGKSVVKYSDNLP